MRGTFPPLKPVGLGSAMVESLTSYARRLSYWLALPVRTVVRAAVPRIPSSDFEFTEAINGTELLGGEIAAGLAALTGLESVAGLSLFAQRRDLHLRWDMRTYRAWCPLCLHGARDTLADPLVWAFTVSTVCTRHGCALQDRCPSRGCGLPHRPWHANAQADLCPHCGKPLGHDDARQVASGMSAIVQDVVGWLQAGHRIGRDQVAAVVRSQVESESIASVARAFGVSEDSVRNWVSGQVRVRMATLVKIAANRGWSMERLTTEAQQLRSHRVGIDPVTPRTAFLRDRVEAELAKPSISRRPHTLVAAELGLGQQALLGHAPRFQILIDQTWAQRRQARADRKAAVVAEAVDAAQRLAGLGEPIRMWRIGQICGWKGSAPEPETRAAIRRALRVA